MSKWTKGPWSTPHLAQDHVDCNCAYVLSDGYFGSIATIQFDNGLLVGSGGNDSPPIVEAKANAKLIAQAPVLVDMAHDNMVIWENVWKSTGSLKAKSMMELNKKALTDAGWYDE